MRLTKLHVQAAFVIGLVAAVGWPRLWPPARTVPVWRTNGPLTPRPELIAEDGRLAYDAAVLPAGSSQGGPGTRTAAFSAVASGRTRITGRARTAFNKPIRFARVLLRNRGSGRIEASATADINGQFSFDHLLLSGYIVELLGANGAVIAASEIATGSRRFATLRVGGNGTPRALFGTSTESGGVYLTPTASEPIGRAADDGAGQTTASGSNASPRT